MDNNDNNNNNNTKKCNKCNIVKSFDCFIKEKRNINGIAYICKDCKKINNKKYYLNKKTNLQNNLNAP